MAQFNENIELLNATGITVMLTNEQSEIIAGGNNTAGSLRLYNATGNNADPVQSTINMDASQATLTIGGQNLDGGLVLQGTAGETRVRVGGAANLWMGGNGAEADIVLFNTTGDNQTVEHATIHLNGGGGDISLGGNGVNGDITLKSSDNQNRVRLKGDANLWMGGNGAEADIVLFKADGDNQTVEQATVHLNGGGGNISLGGNDVNGDITLKSSDNQNRVRLQGTANLWMGGNGAEADIILFRADGDNETVDKATIHLDGNAASLLLGGNGANGDIHMKASNNKERVKLLSDGNLWLGGNGGDGDIMLFRTSGNNETVDEATIHLDGEAAAINLGGESVNGIITLKGTRDEKRVRLLGDGNLWLGGNGGDGDIVIFRANGDNQTLGQASIHLDGEAATGYFGGEGLTGNITLKGASDEIRARLFGSGNLWLGGNGGDGDIMLFRTNGDNATVAQASIHLDGEGGDIIAGGNGVNGELVLKGTANETRARLIGDGNLWLGGNGGDGDIVVFSTTGDNTTLDDATIHLDGQTGNIRCNDVIIPGADFAEDFDIHETIVDTLEPGTVMVLGRDGKLYESTQAFDKKVAGVVSGAGQYRPGITLDKQPKKTHRMPIALSGKVMCKIDASYGSIEVGDLITTSPRKGYAMKASDPFKAFGAVIGKALADFPSGDGLLPILVALQ